MTHNIRPRVMTIYGTRPEAIKCAPLIRAIAESDLLDGSAVVTGQHREMLDQVNKLFEIVPDHDLDIMSHGQTLAQIFARVVEGLDPILVSERPDAVIVQGDTTTSTAAALAAFYREIPVVHLEAGLRSGDLSSPFPEEANRRLTTQIAALHLAPTTMNRANLLREGVSADDVVVTGNTVIDALFHTVRERVEFDDHRLAELERSGQRVVAVTTHRRENWGEPMAGVGRAVARIARDHPDVTIVLPIHRNPVVREAVLPSVGSVPNVLVTEPLSYGQFARLMAASTLLLSDSGGVQEEGPSLGKPVLVMRDTTERHEAVHAGTVRLIGTDEERIVAEVRQLLTDDEHYAAMSEAMNPYGDGSGSVRSRAAIEQLLGVGERVADFDG